MGSNFAFCLADCHATMIAVLSPSRRHQPPSVFLWNAHCGCLFCSGDQKRKHQHHFGKFGCLVRFSSSSVRARPRLLLGEQR